MQLIFAKIPHMPPPCCENHHHQGINNYVRVPSCQQNNLKKKVANKTNLELIGPWAICETGLVGWLSWTRTEYMNGGALSRDHHQ